MSVTLKDLAKASGVSIGTVSRALNDKNEVSAKPLKDPSVSTGIRIYSKQSRTSSISSKEY